MRSDALGMFWRDEPPPPKERKQIKKKAAPDPVWLSEDYLPDISLDIVYQELSDNDLITQNDPFIFDVECYPNYFSVAFLVNTKYIYFELSNRSVLDIDRLKWIVQNKLLSGFNSYEYDIPMVTLALAGLNNKSLKIASDMIIKEGLRKGDLYKHFKVKELKDINHIDLINVAPLDGSLKIYSGRLHCKTMQDLPFHPDSELTDIKMDYVKSYLVNDLSNTIALFKELTPDISLRYDMSAKYQLDLRSRSDAQIAESVIGSSLKAMLGVKRIERPLILPGTEYRYNPPNYMRYESDLMNWVLDRVASESFVVGENGRIGLPKTIADLQLPIGDSVYRMGIGGLHSSEESVHHLSDDAYIIKDVDVVSYYPRIILNQQLYPDHLGPSFLRVYNDIVETRIRAKKAKDDSTANSLKIVINGSFGKLGNKYSIFYSPNLLIQVTLTGQLSLLLLIEMLELNGFEVISANTDGVVTKLLRSREAEFNNIVKNWEKITGFETEESIYKALYSRDVNNYIAIKIDGSAKVKGAYANGGLRKNPTNEICTKAVISYLAHNESISDTIAKCRDIREFLTVRNVKGGAVRLSSSGSQYLGKAIRWYYAGNDDGEIVYAKNGNKVPRTDNGARPIMTLPSEFPADLNFEWYINESYSILKGFGL